MISSRFTLKLLVATLLIGVGIFIGFSPNTFADIEDLTVETGCSEQPSYTGLLNLSQQQYDVYARLTREGEMASVTGYAQPSGAYGDCTRIGHANVSGVRWTKVGTFLASEGEYVIELASNALKNIPDANRPAVMLVPRNNPVCIPDIECTVMINSVRGYVRPAGTLLNRDSLHVLQVVNPAEDSIRQVRYYVDDVLVYTSATLDEFDTRYISYAAQKLSRVIVYSSGQQVILDTISPDSETDNFGDFLFRLSEKYPVTFFGLIGLATVSLVLYSILLIARFFMNRHNYRVHHGFAEDKISPLDRLGSVLYTSNAIKIIRLGILVSVSIVAMLATIILVSTYIVQIITVDGVSMQRSYATGDQLLVNKIPKTLANINGREYVPQRGEVVIVRANFGNAILTPENTSDIVLIKRVLGLPGDRIVIKNGALTVYNAANPEGFQPDKGSAWQSAMTPSVMSENVDVTIEKGEVFVSGDNRPESIDSRFSGPVKTSELVGAVGLKVWPLK